MSGTLDCSFFRKVICKHYDDNALYACMSSCPILESPHNLPPTEADTGEREVCWGPFTLSPRQRSPDPGRGLRPLHPHLCGYVKVPKQAIGLKHVNAIWYTYTSIFLEEQNLHVFLSGHGIPQEVA